MESWQETKSRAKQGRTYTKSSTLYVRPTELKKQCVSHTVKKIVKSRCLLWLYIIVK